MSTFYIDLKYTKLLSGRLPNFKQKRDSVFAFSHSCESATDGRMKARGNLFKTDTGMMFHCYHCSLSSSFSNFLKSEDPTLFQEYRMEVFKENVGSGSKPIFGVKKREAPVIKKEVNIDSTLTPITKLKRSSGVIKYIQSRKIPESTWSDLFVTNDFYTFAARYDPVFEKINKPHPRLIFPFYDVDKNLICYSGRAFGDEQPKYVTVMIDKNRPKIYGLWKINFSRDIIAVEGQIDSLFLDNSIAVNGADYSLPFLEEHKDKIIIVPDSDWKRNVQVFDSLIRAIDLGFRVSLFPDSMPWKDINDCVVKGDLKSDYIMKVIRENIKSGLPAKLEMNFRKKF